MRSPLLAEMQQVLLLETLKSLKLQLLPMVELHPLHLLHMLFLLDLAGDILHTAEVDSPIEKPLLGSLPIVPAVRVIEVCTLEAIAEFLQ